MTHDEIMKLEAGRELDALVAEHVMGTPFVKPTHGICCTCQVCGWSNDNDCQCGYSESVEMAWLVVKKMQDEYYWKIRSPFDNDEPCPWFAGLTPLGVTGWNGVPDFDAHAPTAPLAICRAALLAVMDNRP